MLLTSEHTNNTHYLTQQPIGIHMVVTWLTLFLFFAGRSQVSMLFFLFLFLLLLCIIIWCFSMSRELIH